jgi:hypothetical protein
MVGSRDVNISIESPRRAIAGEQITSLRFATGLSGNLPRKLWTVSESGRTLPRSKKWPFLRAIIYAFGFWTAAGLRRFRSVLRHVFRSVFDRLFEVRKSDIGVRDYRVSR